MEEEESLDFQGARTVQTLVKHDATNYDPSLPENFFGGGTQNGRFVHTGNVINISNESNWVDGGVASPSRSIIRPTVMVYCAIRTWMEAMTSDPRMPAP